MASSVQNPAGKKAMQEGGQRTRVIKPDAGQIYHVDAPKEAIANVSVVDVDVVIRLTNGETIVLAEAGLAAMSGGNIQVHYTNGSAPISDLFNQTGLATIPVTSDLTQNIPAYSAQTKTVAKEEKTNSETPDAGGSAGVGMSSVSTTVKIDKLIEKVLQLPKITAPVVLAEIKRPEIVPMTSSSPASSKAKQEELVGSENNVLQAAFYSDSKTAQIGGIFYGGYGAKTAETNASLSAAMETNPVAGFSAGMEVRANPLNGVSFQKTMRLTYTGVTTPETITLTNLPSSTVIVGAQRNADGSYVLNAAQYAQNGSSKIFDIPFQYKLYQVDSANPVHEDYTLKVDFAGSIGTNVLHNILSVNIKVVDGASASQLETYAQTAGSSAIILSAQGANYEFTALGNNTITGGANADTIHSAVGNNVLNGGGGQNTLTYDLATSGVAIDMVNGTAKTATSSDAVSNFQNVVGSAYSDVMRAGTNTLSMDGGAGGNDTFDPNGAGSQANPLKIKGSATGFNILDLSGSAGGLQVDAAQNSVTGSYGNVSFSNIDMIVGSHYGDTIKGPDSGNVTIDAGGGADVITGGLGGLTLTYANATQGVTVDLHDGFSTGYGSGRSTLSGNIQHIIGSSQNDLLIGNKLYTRILDGGAGGNDTFDPGGGGTYATPVEIIGSSTGNNLLTLANAASGFGVVADLANGTVAGGYGNVHVSHIQQVIGTRYDDTMIATSDTTLLDGGAGGNDVFDVNHAQNITVIGGVSGRSTLTLANETAQGASGAVKIDVAQGMMTGAYGNATLVNISNVIGTASGDDTMIAGNSSVNFQAGNGNVSLTGSAKDDTLNGGAGNATLIGGGGNDILSVTKGLAGSTFKIVSGTGDDRILIGEGTSTVELYGGDDRIDIQSTQAHVTLDFSKAGVSSTGGIYADLVNSVVTGIDKASVFIAGTGQVERLIGTAGSDYMRGTSKTNYFDGGVSGNDSFDVSTLAAATIIGSASGQNKLQFHDQTAGLQIDFTTGIYQSANNVSGQFSNISSLKATDFSDRIVLAAQKVSLDAGDGNDTIIAGTGDVTIVTGAGNESIVLGSGTATITTGTGNDTIVAGSGVATISAGTGNNTISAINALADNTSYAITGGADSDVITVGRGAFTVNGNSGSSNAGESDLIIVDASATSASTYVINGGAKSDIRLGLGSATVRGGSGDDTITAGAGNATITGNGGNDSINLGTGVANVITGAGADTISAGAGAANISAGAGLNTITAVNGIADNTSYSITGGADSDAVTVGRGIFTINGNNGTSNSGEVDTITVDATATAASSFSITGSKSSVIRLGLGSATVMGGTGNDTIVAGAGNATITGNGGNDSITLGAGTATVTAGSGNDTIIAGSGTANISSGDGTNLIRANNALSDTTRYSIIGGTGNDSITLGRGAFTVSGNNGTSSSGEVDTITVDATATAASSFSITGGASSVIRLALGSSTVTGSTGNDTIVAGAGNATITGNGGNDSITLGAGTATVTAGSGNDTIIAGSGAANISSGNGTNFIRAINALSDTTRYSITGGTGNDSLTLGRGAFTINGNGGNETITVDASSTTGSTYSISGGLTNTINLGLGSATVVGGTGNDSIVAGIGNATITGNGGLDTIRASNGTASSVYSIAGGSAADQIFLGLGTATVNGASGGADNITISNQGNYLWNFNGVASGVNVNMTAGTAVVAGSTQRVTGGTMQSIQGSASADTLVAGAGTLQLDGNGGNDVFDMGTATNAQANPLVVIGGSTSVNTLTFANNTGGLVAVNLVNGTAYSGTGYANLSGANIRSIIGSTRADTFVLGANSNTQSVSGGGGNDTITANTGNATSNYVFTTGAGNDSLNLGLGNFTVTAGGGNDTLTLSQQGNITLQFSNNASVNANLSSGLITQTTLGTITVQGGSVQNIIGTGSSDTLTGGSNTLLLDGGTAGNDVFDMGGAGTVLAPVTIRGSAAGNHVLSFANDTIGGVSVDMTSFKVSGSYGNANLSSANLKMITGSTFSDTFNLTSANMSIVGNGGNDTITVNNATAASNYNFITGSGNDSFRLGLGNYTIDVGGGNDTLNITAQGNYTLTFANDAFGANMNLVTGQIIKAGSNGNLTLANTSFYIQSAIGSAQNDTITGGKQTVLMDGGSGGSDKFVLGDNWATGGNVTVKGTNSTYHMLSFEGVTNSSTAVTVDLTADSATAGTGSANIAGLNVGYLVGGKGNDTMTISNLINVDGGGGSDTLIYKGISSFGNNNISLGGLGVAVKNMSTVDLSKNVFSATSGFNYSISTQDIINMTSSSKDITIRTFSNAGVADTHVVTSASGHSYSENASGLGTITAGGTSYTVHWITAATH